MFGREYLDYKSECAAERVIDAFLAAMEPGDRKWALAVLRKRHVTYRDSPLAQLGRFSPSDSLQTAMANQRNQCSQSRYSSVGGVFGNILGL